MVPGDEQQKSIFDSSHFSSLLHSWELLIWYFGAEKLNILQDQPGKQMYSWCLYSCYPSAYARAGILPWGIWTWLWKPPAVEPLLSFRLAGVQVHLFHSPKNCCSEPAWAEPLCFIQWFAVVGSDQCTFVWVFITLLVSHDLLFLHRKQLLGESLG